MAGVFFYFVLGHILSALIVYLNHRFVFHGKLGKLPILKITKRLHALHHKHAYDDERNSYFEPLWVKVSFYCFLLLVGSLVNWSFSLGLLSFGLLYAFRHKKIHNEDRSSYFSVHHWYHHTVSTKCNYSGIYPSIDYLFGTAASQKNK
jgi:sterol desaturase/sphingolipid hydroxylase (fatty acid hydroxylase superfamily)